MIKQSGFVIEFTIKVWHSTTIFIFCCLTHVIEVHNMLMLCDYISPTVILLQNCFKFTNPKKGPPVTLFSHGLMKSLENGSHKNSATTTAMAIGSAIHCSGDFSCDWPFWQLWLYQWVLPPGKNDCFFVYCQGWGSDYLGGQARHSTARTEIVFKK